MTIFGLQQGSYKAFDGVKNHYNYVDNLFLRGKLATENQFDLVGADDKLFQKLKMTDTTVIDVDVVLSNGKMCTAKIYWWHDKENRQHGLVCDIADRKACAYAKKHMEQKAPHLNYNIPKK